MKNPAMKSTQFVADSYVSYHRSVYFYISNKINNQEDAEDLSHDVFLRLMDYKEMLRPDTVKHFIFTIARNLVYDYLRHYYKGQEVNTYLYEEAVTYTNDTESRVIADDLLVCERQKVRNLPFQRGRVYAMSRFEQKSVADISQELNLSRRTVENHLSIGRKEVRAYIRKCIV